MNLKNNIASHLYIENFKNKIYSLFGNDVKWNFSNLFNKDYISGFFYREEDFKIPFKIFTENEYIEIKIYFSINFEFNENNSPIKSNIVSCTDGLVKTPDFKVYIDKLSNFFNEKTNLLLKNFFNNFYFIDNLENLNEDKRSNIEFNISKEYSDSFYFHIDHNYKEKDTNNRFNIQIDIDKNKIILKDSKDFRMSAIDYYDDIQNIHTIFNKHFKLKENICNKSDFNSKTTMCSIIEKINEFKKLENIINY